MILEGDYKYITLSIDGEWLFNVADDPDERNNSVNDPKENIRLEAFRSDCTHKWDEAALTSATQQSQRRRILVRTAMSEGVKQRWNHNEAGKDQVIWHRGEQGYNEWAFKHI